MMRSLYSAVSGLKTHQTKMDVIGNNIANVNTVAFKASKTTFQDILYQTTSQASGANQEAGTGGVNEKQIGLGVSMASTKVTITSSGAAESTGDAFDIRLTDANSTNFFIVNNGSENLFTRSGSFYVDGAGNLCMTSTGYTVMGWQVDPDTNEIKKDTVSALRVMATENLSSPPEYTTNGVCSGVLDKNDPDVLSDSGLYNTLTFYDNLGYAYTARFAIKSSGTDGTYTVELEKILNSDGTTFYDPGTSTTPALQQLFGSFNQNVTLHSYDSVEKGFCIGTDGSVHVGNDPTANEALTWDKDRGVFTDNGNPETTYTLKQIYNISDSMVNKIAKGSAAEGGADVNLLQNGTLVITGNTTNYDLTFSTADGSFTGVGPRGGQGMDSVFLNMNVFGNQFSNISIDFTQLKDANNNGKSTAGMDSGALDGTTGKGKKLGALIGLSVDNSGKIFGSYDNGNTELLGQIAVAQFANASGLEKVGDNCYTTTLNSGDFDGIGIEISADGSKMTSGELEMSNVDLSTEFTQMIITQRGFQANSRVITTSDTLLEELVNLKR